MVTSYIALTTFMHVASLAGALLSDKPTTKLDMVLFATFATLASFGAGLLLWRGWL